MGEWTKQRIDSERGIVKNNIQAFRMLSYSNALDEIERLQNEVSVRDGLLEQMANETGNEILRLRSEIETLNKFHNSDSFQWNWSFMGTIKLLFYQRSKNERI